MFPPTVGADSSSTTSRLPSRSQAVETPAIPPPITPTLRVDAPTAVKTGRPATPASVRSTCLRLQPVVEGPFVDPSTLFVIRFTRKWVALQQFAYSSFEFLAVSF